MDTKLEFLLKNMPSIDGNSLYAFFIRLVSFLAGVGLIIIGLSLIIAHPMEQAIIDYLFESGMKPTEAFQNQLALFTNAVGLLSLVIGVILMILRHIAGQVLTRNGYLYELRSWYKEQLTLKEASN